MQAFWTQTLQYRTVRCWGQLTALVHWFMQTPEKTTSELLACVLSVSVPCVHTHRYNTNLLLISFTLRLSKKNLSAAGAIRGHFKDDIGAVSLLMC